MHSYVVHNCVKVTHISNQLKNMCEVPLLIMSYVPRLLASAVVAVLAVTVVMFVEEVGLIIVLYGISTNNLAL